MTTTAHKTGSMTPTMEPFGALQVGQRFLFKGRRWVKFTASAAKEMTADHKTIYSALFPINQTVATLAEVQQ